MTVVCFDRKNIAVDRGMSYGNMLVDKSKYRRMDDGSVFFTVGDASTAGYMLDLYAAGTLFENWPAALQSNCESRATLIRIFKGKVETLFAAPSWTRWTGLMAWGSGSDIAFGALLAGADARKAAKIAAKHSIGCGLGVDVFRVR